MAEPTKPGVAVGRVVGGRYRVDAVLGAGGMGVVARALAKAASCALPSPR